MAAPDSRYALQPDTVWANSHGRIRLDDRETADRPITDAAGAISVEGPAVLERVVVLGSGCANIRPCNGPFGRTALTTAIWETQEILGKSQRPRARSAA